MFDELRVARIEAQRLAEEGRRRDGVAFRTGDERREITVERDRFHIVGGVEAAMDLGDGADPALHVRQCRAGLRLLGTEALLLEVDERADQRERVGDAVVDLPQQRFGAIARLPHLPLRRLLLAPHPVLGDRVLDGVLEELDEDAADVLDDVVDGSRLQRGDGDAPLVAATGVDHRRMIGHRLDLGEDFEALLARHEMVEHDGVEALRGGHCHALRASVGQQHLVSLPRQRPLHEPAQTGIIVDVEQSRRRRGNVGHVGSGTCMIERNRPS